MNLPDSTAQPLTLHTRDGYPLAALRYPAQGPRRGNLIVAGATGVGARGGEQRRVGFAHRRIGGHTPQRP